MLSKRASDILFIVIILLMIGTLVAGRFYILNSVDERIDDTEAENAQLESEISAHERLVSDFQTDELPRMSEMNREIPAYYDENQLTYFVLTQLEYEGISSSGGRNLTVSITDNPNFPENTDFLRLSNELDAYRITVRFNTADTDEISEFVGRMHDQDQLFILQSVQYENPGSEALPITINFIAYYYPSEE